MVFWLFAVAWLTVLGSIAFVALPRIIREGQRLLQRVVAIVDESPLPLQIAKAQTDLTRMQVALDSLPQLQRRAIAALTVIRTTPLVPPAVGEITTRIAAQIREFRQATTR